MDWTWANALSPIAVVILGVWIKKSQEKRAGHIAEAAARTKTAADGAEALARENLAKAIDIEIRAGRIENNVDGRLTKAVDDLAAANAAITKMAVIQEKILRLLDNPADIAAAQRAIKEQWNP